MNKKSEFEEIAELLAKFPGINLRSAKNLIIYLLDNEYQLKQFLSSLKKIDQGLARCSICGNIDFCLPCNICMDSSRDKKRIVIVSGVSELWSIEKSGIFQGHYHVLGTTLSINNDSSLSSLRMEQLKNRCIENAVEEVIVACDSNIEGQATAHYIKEYLGNDKILITKPASGIPVGSEIQNMDEGTITAAFNLRQKL